MQVGLAKGLSASKINIFHVIDQLEDQLLKEPFESPYMVLKSQMPASFSEKQKSNAQNELLRVIKHSIYPGLSAYRDYLKFELLPAARKTYGISNFSFGKICYQNLIERHTGIRKSPQEIHELGLIEVELINLYFGGAEAVSMLKHLVKGEYSFLFWIVEIFLGGILPIMILLRKKITPQLQAIASVLILIGIFTMRYIVVVGGQVPTF